jgi:hypothetical protein
MNETTEPAAVAGTFEERAEAVLACTFYGIHHCPDIKKVPDEFGRWEVNMVGQLSTFDSDQLTRLVVAAHHYCVRASVTYSGPRMIKIMLHNRKGRTGGFSQRHPTMEEAVSAIGL